ncbi:MAG: hydroxylamine reductase [Bacteroidales bacterium]|nr:hydroxylamine reductase [Bacteroidales bacterium]
MEMFCYQCQETAKGTGCTLRGVCGKLPETSARMDLLLYATRGVAILNETLREAGAAQRDASHQVIDALFTTITNANFDNDSLDGFIRRAFQMKRELKAKCKELGIEIPDAPEVTLEADPADYEKLEPVTGVLAEPDADKRGLKQLAIYGAKGAAAYTRHAANLKFEDEEVYKYIEHVLKEVSRKDISVDELVKLVLYMGEGGVKAMALLDKANTTRYGNPEITKVNIGVRKNPGILISGHDLHDLEELLEQTAGTGVDVYTHSEMLPGQYYPFFKKYPHFAGNYGNAWWKQVDEFETFNGCFVFTSNCIVPPRKNCTYLDRVYTLGVVDMPGTHHIEADPEGHHDFSEVIAKAKGCPAPTEIEKGEIIGGFAHHQVIELAPKIVELVKEGKIRKFVVMAGCDGRFPSRSYYTEFAEALPKDCVILTAGCAKYRYNKLSLGDIEGVPRVLDAGQCNDSYSLVRIAMALQEAFGLSSINELPLVFNIAWYEQKAVIVLLALLYLGVQNIHTGPTLPAFFTPDILKVLQEKFNIGTISTVEKDIKKLIG